ncbi:chymotrypsin-1 [Drosophila ananassae]|uniref:chymotrypsin-1 n=1 Tax=Drosophila ananassae TaxID=7217 RepID=UPI001CFF8A79|nr:chymotrypsin-1 [Drosophila ananassae]
MKECHSFNKYFLARQPSGYTPHRIVGGADVPPGEHVPYQVSLQYQTRNGQMHFCGGSIIAPNRILTAAHCCQGLNASRMSVVAGIRSLQEIGSRSKVLSFTIHPDYKELVTSDLSVLYIDPPLEFDNTTIGAIDLQSNYVGGGVPVTLTGWGLRLWVPFPYLDDVNYPNVLQRMSYHTITNQECRNAGMDSVTDTEVCARGPFRGACSGDSGGPLVMRTDEGLKQVGIVSYGLVVCGLFISPDVYTRVSTFTEWIVGHLEF